MALRKRKPAPKLEYYDRLETRHPKGREAALMLALPKLVAHAKKKAPGFARILKDVNPGKITSREALSGLPLVEAEAQVALALLQADELRNVRGRQPQRAARGKNWK